MNVKNFQVIEGYQLDIPTRSIQKRDILVVDGEGFVPLRRSDNTVFFTKIEFVLSYERAAAWLKSIRQEWEKEDLPFKQESAKSVQPQRKADSNVMKALGMLLSFGR